MFWIVLVAWAVGMFGVLRLIAGMDYVNDHLQQAVRPSTRCYIEGDTEAEIAETLLRGLAKERVA
jgi:hypothetical protein